MSNKGLMEQLNDPHYAHLTKEGIVAALTELFYEREQRKVSVAEQAYNRLSPEQKKEFNKAIKEDFIKAGFTVS